MLSILSLRDLFDWWRFSKAVTSNRRKLEEHLKSEKTEGRDLGRRTMKHLQRHLRLTEDEIWKAVRSSKKIKVLSHTGERGRTEGHYFEYE